MTEVETPLADQEEVVSLQEQLNLIPVFESKSLRLSLSEGQQRIGVTIFGRRGSVGVSLKEVEKSKKYAVQVSPHHKYGNDFPGFPYFIPCNQLSAMNLINKVALAIFEADQNQK